MAKKNKRRKQNNNQGGGVFGEDLVREILGNFVGNLMSDGLGAAVASRLGGDGAGALPPPPRDLAADVLRLLAEQGPKSVPDLVELTGSGLSPLLGALHTVRDFRLVEFLEEGSVVQLTDGGNRTVTVLRKDDIREQAQRLLSAGAE